MKIDYTPKLTFDDVLLEPQHSDIKSREEEIDVTVNFLGHQIIPVISSNMDFVTGVNMAVAMEDAGCLGIINRFEDSDKQYEELFNRSIGPVIKNLYISVGVRHITDELTKIEIFRPYGVCVDVAHGDHKQVADLIHIIRLRFPSVQIIAGNVATEDGFYRLAVAGADAVKVGIGPGSVCTTREVTGVGVPQFSAILACAPIAKQYGIKLIADGGINSSGDIVKALAAGADTVMLGRLLAGHNECPGEKVVLSDGRAFKPYRGQSMLGANGSRYAPEGISGFVPARGKVADTLKTLIGGIKSGFSYVGARNLKELQENASFITVSNATKHENSTRVLQEV